MLRILFLLKVELHDGISCMLGVYEKAKKFHQKKKMQFVMGPSTMEFDVSSLICVQALSIYFFGHK